MLKSKYTRNRERGFTLIELIVVIAILGVLAAIAVPTIVNFLSSSKTQSYNAEKERIQTVVDAFYSAPGNDRYTGKRQYPILGHSGNTALDSTAQTNAGGTGTAVSSTDLFSDDRNMLSGTTTVNGLTEPVWNPVGGTVGADLITVAKWADSDTDGVRPADGSEDTWASVLVTRGGVTYYTDPRYFFIDFELLVSEGLLDAVPNSAAPDNDQDGVGSDSSKTGSYIWYVDGNGKVQSLYTQMPSATGADSVIGGFQTDVFP